jgi:hypothetical protein
MFGSSSGQVRPQFREGPRTRWPPRTREGEACSCCKGTSSMSGPSRMHLASLICRRPKKPKPLCLGWRDVKKEIQCKHRAFKGLNYCCNEAHQAQLLKCAAWVHEPAAACSAHAPGLHVCLHGLQVFA